MALLRDRFQHAAEGDSPYRLMPIELLAPDPHQPRSAFRKDLEAALKEQEFLDFVAHLKAFGRVTTPLQVRPPDPDTGISQIIAGERRWRAAREAGLTHVPVVLYDESDPLRLRLAALAENFFRAELPLWDRATFISEILEETGCTQADLATQFGLSSTQISKYLAITKYPEDLRDAVRDGLVMDTETARNLNLADSEARKDALAEARHTRRPIQRRRAERLASKEALRKKFASGEPSALGASSPQPATGFAPPVLVRLPRVPEDQLVALLRHHSALPEGPTHPDEIVEAFLGLLSRLAAG